MTTNRKISLVVLAIFVAAATAFATTYCVDPSAGSDSNSGTSQTSAWQHIPGTLNVSGSGWAMLNAGDSVIVKGGTVQTASVQIDSNRSTNDFALTAGTPSQVLVGDTMASPMNYDIIMAPRTQFSLGAYEGGTATLS